MVHHPPFTHESDEAISVVWLLRSVPLAPSAVAAWGDIGHALARRVLARRSVEHLTAVVADDLLVIIGPPDVLPWTDGVVYLGSEPSDPFLLMPTTLAPSVPVDILSHALHERFGHQHLAVLPSIGIVAPLDCARAIAPDLLAAWIGQPPTHDNGRENQ